LPENRQLSQSFSALAGSAAAFLGNNTGERCLRITRVCLIRGKSRARGWRDESRRGTGPSWLSASTIESPRREWMMDRSRSRRATIKHAFMCFHILVNSEMREYTPVVRCARIVPDNCRGTNYTFIVHRESNRTLNVTGNDE